MVLKCIANRGVQDSAIKTSGWVRKIQVRSVRELEIKVFSEDGSGCGTANPIRFQTVDLPESA